jgi:hypothetical protein
VFLAAASMLDGTDGKLEVMLKVLAPNVAGELNPLTPSGYLRGVGPELLSGSNT